MRTHSHPAQSIGNFKYIIAFAALLSASTALSQTAPQTTPNGLVVKVAPIDQSQFLTNEYRANWGLPLHNFAAAYAEGATGQGVILGQLDTDLYSAHPEMAHLNLLPFPNTLPYLSGAIEDDGEVKFHGQHVAGLAVANRDGFGMHGGSWGSTTFYNTNPWSEGFVFAQQQLSGSGANFINHSYGPDLSNYRLPIFRDDQLIGIATVNLSQMELSPFADNIEKAALDGVVNVTAAGNDRLYAASPRALNRYNARPRLFRGIPPGAGMSTLSVGIASNDLFYNDESWRKIEKGTVTAVMLNGTEEISSYSALCGVSKYSCIGTAGGMLAEPHQDYTVQLPDLPFPTEYYSPDSTGTKYIDIRLSGEILASQYRMLSLATQTTAPANASNEEKLAALEPIYKMALGTSMASPMLMAGLGVTKSRFPYLENWQVRDVVLTTGRDIGAPGIDRVYGWGIMDLEAAMGGPRKLFAVKRSYLQKNPTSSNLPDNLYDFEIEQAKHYEVDVARADVFATRAYDLKVQMMELEEEAVNASNEAALASTTEARRTELLALAATNRALIADLTPQEQSARAEAYRLELTRIQPNLPEDTEEAAFESIIWDVNLPGERTDDCDSERCVADYWTNDIDGPGGLNKLGAGTLALAGTNTYQGGTTVSGGTLQFGLGGETGSVTGDIVNNASIIVARSNEWDYKGSISGSGTLSLYGDGTLRLSGENTYSGETNIYRGNLAVDGSILSHSNILAGGVLSGTGQVASISAQDGSLVSPGNSIGTLTANGNVSLLSGSTYLAEYNQSSSDRLVVNGDVAIVGAQLVLASTTQDPDARKAETISLIDQRHNIIEASGAVDGQFAKVETNARFLFITPQVYYDPATVAFGYSRNGVEFASFATTDNQNATAETLEDLSVSNPLAAELLTTDRISDLATNYQSLSGELHASTASFLLGGSNRSGAAVTNRLRGATGAVGSHDQAVIEPLSYAKATPKTSPEAFKNFIQSEPATALWGEAFGSWTRFDGDKNAIAYKGRNSGIIAGGDIGFETSGKSGRLGFFGAYQSGSVSSHINGSASTDSYSAGLYTGFDIEGFGIRLGAGYNWHEISTERLATLGSISNINTADYDGHSANVFGEIGYAFKLHEAKIEPFAALNYARLKTDAFVETGGPTALSVHQQANDYTVSTLGIRAAHTVDIGGTMVTSRGALGWNHGFGDIAPKGQFNIAGLNPFTVHGGSLAKNAAFVEAGLEFKIAPNATLGISYQGQWAADYRENAVKANFGLKF